MLTVRLLGPPAFECDGGERPSLRGRKAWALLAYLALAARPPSRQRLVSLLFSEAEDPLGALRWNLSELRRALASVATIRGDPVELCVGPGLRIDVQVLLAGRLGHGAELVRLGGLLLEGTHIDASPAFEAWLVAERQRVAASCHALLYESALDALATGRPEQAAGMASRAIELDPYSGDCHTVLVRSLIAAGDVRGAQLHAARCADLFQRDLGQDPPPSVARAVSTSQPRRGVVRGTDSSASARSYLDVGRASVAAGSIAVGLGQLRRAVEVAVAIGDRPLTATAMVALATGTIHGAGGRGAEVAELLHEGLALARTHGEARTAATACLELAFLGVQLGHRERVEVWLEEAEQLEPGAGEWARIWGLRGMSRTDAADYPGALDALHRSIEHAERAGSDRQTAWSNAMVGRIHVLRGEPAQAALVLDQALGTLHDTGWTDFLPWAESFRAEAAIGCGDPHLAAELLDHAWVLATEARDHCWMATVARGLARLAVAGGEHDAGVGWVEAGLRPRPWYVWPRAHLLDMGCDLALPDRPELAARWSDELSELAARGGMREHVVRARLHRVRLGEADQLLAARHDAADIDNPALDRLLERSGADG